MKYLYSLTILLAPYILFSQSMKNLEGRVLNEHNMPISNAHIQINGTNIGTISNSQGSFNLKIPKQYCNSDLVFSHISYLPDKKKIVCWEQDYLIILTERLFELDEVQVSALSVEQIVLNAIANLEKNYQVDSVNYTLFSRYTETLNQSPVLLEESVFNLFHTSNSKPEFNIIKVRGKGFDKLGEERFSEARLIGIHTTESHIMLRYLPDFLKKKKMKNYEFELISEDETHFFVNAASNEARSYPKGGKIHINKNDFAISYVQKIYSGDDYFNTYESNYMKLGTKWFFTHGSIIGWRYGWRYYKKPDIRINRSRITVVIERDASRQFNKVDEMGRMAKMLSEFKGSFDDNFWEAYNYIPLDSIFKSSLTNAKNP